MREIIFKRAETRELSENAWDSREMRETWQVCITTNLLTIKSKFNAYFVFSAIFPICDCKGTEMFCIIHLNLCM